MAHFAKYTKGFDVHMEYLGEQQLVALQGKGAAALAVLERGLADRAFLLGDQVSLADVALYAYTHVAPDAGLALEPYPAIGAWLRRFESEPWWEPITAR